MRTKLLVLAVSGALALVVSPSPAFATHSWSGYHWARQSNPFTIKLGNNLDATWQTYLSRASSDWTGSTVLDTTIVSGLTRPRNCKATVGRVEVCNAAYGNTGWLGIASISITGGTHITQGTVKLNDTYFNTAQYNGPGWRQMVTCQEVGHTFGLDHQDTTFGNTNLGTCMDYTDTPLGLPSNEHPDKHDYDELGIIYAHLDSTTTVGAVVQQAGQPQVGEDASTWGRQVEGSRSAGFSTYVRDFGSGNLAVTFVTWA